MTLDDHLTLVIAAGVYASDRYQQYLVSQTKDDWLLFESAAQSLARMKQRLLQRMEPLPEPEIYDAGVSMARGGRKETT
jgi:hypothetical protein